MFFKYSFSNSTCQIFLTQLPVDDAMLYIYFRYSFYDGPPFATGLPHYGHILAGTIKDVVTRYAHQQVKYEPV